MDTLRQRNVHGGDRLKETDKMSVENEMTIRSEEGPSTSAQGSRNQSETGRYWIAGLFFTTDDRLWNVVRLSGRVMGSAIGLILLLALYTVIGALIFVAVEGPHETVVRNRIHIEKQMMLESMWNMSMNGSDVSKEDFIRLGDTLLKNYTKEVVSASQAGINTEPESPKKWDFWGGVTFCLTIYTTIGYGHIAPATDPGRIATMLYATIGIPLCLVVLVKVGKIFTRLLKLSGFFLKRTVNRIKQACQHKTKDDSGVGKTNERSETGNNNDDNRDDNSNISANLTDLKNLYEKQDSAFDVPIVVAIILVLLYMFLGAVLYRTWETWSYTEAVYFIFISISTIGFGDVLPEHPKYFLLVSVYIFVGLSLVSMVINVLMDFMAEKLDQAQEKLQKIVDPDAEKKESSGNDVET